MYFNIGSKKEKSSMVSSWIKLIFVIHHVQNHNI